MGPTNPWDNDAVVPANGGMVITKPASPGYKYEGPKSAEELRSIQLANQKSAAASPYDQQNAANDAALKADQRAEADQKAADLRAAAAVKPSGNQHGPAYLATLTPERAALIRGVAVGNISLGQRPFATPESRALLQDVVNFDPSFDMSNYNARAQANQAFRTGKFGQMATSLNTALPHSAQVADDVQKLDNFSVAGPLLNPIRNGVKSFFGSTDASNLTNDLKAFGGELGTTFGGGSSGEGERGAWEKSIPVNANKTTQLSTLQHDAGLLNSRREAIEFQARQSLGPYAKLQDFISPEAQAAYDKLMAIDPNAPSSSGRNDSAAGLVAPAGGAGGPPPPPNISGPTPFDPNNPSLGPTGGAQTPVTGAGLLSGSTRTVPLAQLNGIINHMVRSGASSAAIGAALGQYGYGAPSDAQLASARAYLQKYPNYQGSFGGLTQQVPTTFRERASGSAPGALLSHGLNAAAMGVPAAALGNQATLDAQSAVHPYASAAGTIGGGIAGAAGLEFGLAGAAARAGGGVAARLLASPRTADAVYGAVSGAAGDPDHPLTGALTGGVTGVSGGMFGRGLTSGVGKVVRGVQNSDVRYLAGQGVPLTVGQAVSGGGVVGQTIKGLEDKLTSVPGVGDMIRARRLDGMQGFNRTAFDQALVPIGATTGGVTKEAGIDAAQDAVHNAYGQALNGVTVQADAPFVRDMGATIARGRALPEPMAGNANYTLNTSVGNSFSPTGSLSGNDFQQALRGLNRDSATVANQPYGYDFGQVADDAKSALRGMVDRQAPGVLPAYDAAGQAFRQTEVLRDAVNRARNGTRVGEPGTFAPSQLADAGSANARRFGNSAGTTNQPFFDLSRAGQSVLPSSIPDSGTTGRLSALALPSLLGGAGAGLGYASGDGASDAESGAGAGLGLGALLALGGTKVGQRALTGALLNRTAGMQTLGNQIIGRRMFGGLVGAGVGGNAPALFSSNP